MKRPASAQNNLERTRRRRSECPEITLRSTFIVGFPGKTEAAFEELLAFLEQPQVNRVDCFAYSPVDGASANALPDPVPEPLREQRRTRFMAVQERISAARLRPRIGQTNDVLVDQAGPLVRRAAHAPEIDGKVYVERAHGLAADEFARMRITHSDAHDLWSAALT